MSETSTDSPLSTEARLAILEERTKPKARTIFERVKDWSGILTFVVAVLYTYPLGVWDRFVVTAKQQRVQEISDLRSVVLQLTQADAEFVKAFAGVTDPSLQQVMGATTNARKGALLAPNLTLIKDHFAALTGAELELLAYQVNQLGDQGALASRMLEDATEKMTKAKNTIGAADVMRIHAQLYGPFGSMGPNISKTRELLQKSIGLLLQADPLKSLAGAGAVAIDWANYEAVSGDWSCAQQLGNWVIAQAQYSNPAYAQQLQSQLAQMAAFRQNSTAPWIPVVQSTDQCPTTVIPWNVAGWPWTARN